VKQIKILLSSVLTLLLITGNNTAYAAPHYTDFNGGKFQGKKPNTNVFKGQVRKGNRYVPDGRNDGKVTLKRKALPNRNSGGHILDRCKVAGKNMFGGCRYESPVVGVRKGNMRKGNMNAFKGQARKGNMRKGNRNCVDKPGPIKAKLLPGMGEVQTLKSNKLNGCGNKSSIDYQDYAGGIHTVLDIEGTGEGVIKSTGAFDIAPVGKDGFTASSEEQHISGKDGVLGGQESGWFHPVDGSITNTTTTPTIIDHWVVTPKPDGALGPDVVTTLEHGPGIWSTGGAHAVADSSTGACIDGECKDKDHIYIGENGKAGIFVQDVGPEGKDGFIVQAGEDGLHNNGAFRAGINDDGTGQQGGVFDDTQNEDGVIDGTSNTVSPKGVPLKFINGVWTEDLPYD